MNHPCPDALELMARIEMTDWIIKLPDVYQVKQLYAHKLRAKTLQEIEEHKRTCEVCDD
jgi:hypothetical protein